MSQFAIKLPKKIYEDVLVEILKENLRKPLEAYKIEYSAGSSKGDNYIGIVHRIQVTDIKDEKLVMSLIVKLPPESHARRTLMDVHSCFVCESNFYSKIYPIYKNFQAEKGIDIEKEGFHEIPMCYKTLVEEHQEGIFFKDLKVEGFEMFDRHQDLTREHVFLVMKVLAKMHAAYFCIRHYRPEVLKPFQNIVDYFVKRCQGENSAVKAWANFMKDEAVKMIEKQNVDQATQHIKTFFEKDYLELYKECLPNQNDDPYIALCHGDCWNNNVMFKYDQNGQPCDVRLLDFQVMSYASPVTDLMYFIFCCTTKELRNRHYQEFLDTYYQELTVLMLRLGCDPETLYPRKIFDSHLIKYGKFGLLKATMVLPIITSDPSEITDMDEISEKITVSKNSGETIDVSSAKYTTDKTYEAYAERMMDVCRDMYCLGYL